MTYIIALLAGVVGAVAGYTLAAALAGGIAVLAGMSNFEGAIGYFAVFGVGPLGGLAGLIAGVWLVLRYRGGYRGGALLGRSIAGLVAVGALAAGALGVFYLQRDVINPDGLPPQLLFEIRLPAGTGALPTASAISIELDTDRNRMPAALASNGIRRDGDRVIIVGGVELYYRTSHRILVLRLPNQPARLFTLKLRASPAASDAFGAWQRADAVDDMQGQPHRTDASETHEIRYRVEDRSRARMAGIDFEIRLPEGTVLPQDAATIRIALRTDDKEYDGSFLAYDWRRQDGARPVLVGAMGIPDPTAHPRVVVALPGMPACVFAVEWPAGAGFSAWRQADAVEEQGHSPRAPRAGEAFEFRYANADR